MNKPTIEESQEARRLMDHPDNPAHSRRLQVIALRGEGYTQRETAEIVGLHIRTVNDTCKKFKDGGFDALREHRTSNSWKVDFEAVDKFLEKYVERSKKAEILSTREIWLDFQDFFQVSYTLEAFYRLLDKHGWRKVRPRPEHPQKADAETIEASKKLTLIS